MLRPLPAMLLGMGIMTLISWASGPGDKRTILNVSCFECGQELKLVSHGFHVKEIQLRDSAEGPIDEYHVIVGCAYCHNGSD